MRLGSGEPRDGSGDLFWLGPSAVEPTFRQLPLDEGLMAAAFRVTTASSTAGFNAVSIGSRLMFAGRVGSLTIGLALLQVQESP